MRRSASALSPTERETEPVVNAAFGPLECVVGHWVAAGVGDPTEVAAALSAARTVVGSGRIIAVHQPHLYSRTRLFAREFAEALETYADETIVLDVYGAREDPEPGVDGGLVASHVPLAAERVHFEPSWSATPAALVARARPGDLVLTLGAGDVTLVGPEVLELLEERARPQDPGEPGEPGEQRARQLAKRRKDFIERAG